ncbi:MAG: formyltetrahydrofolate deformylase [uncultured archaeon A07HR60]|nr:MAG: formyltetrahydrofolate deformylase [uncultured archaeon A07HR60]
MNHSQTEITVVGDDDTGLIANITTLLFERGVNIKDIEQAVHDGVFQMRMRVGTDQMVCSTERLRDDLSDLAAELGVDITVRVPDSDSHSIAAFVTKESHCLEALLEACASGSLDATVDVVIGNHSVLQPLADSYDVPFHDIGDEKGTPDEGALLEVLDEHDPDLLLLARYIRILGPEIVFRYSDRIINVHPSLLPAFPGASAYRQAIEEGVRIAGVTAHYVTPDLDQGPIITQRAFNVPDEATEAMLREKAQPLEAEALLEAARLHLNGAIATGRGRTHIRETDDDINLGLPAEIDRLIPSQPVDKDRAEEKNSTETADD